MLSSARHAPSRAAAVRRALLPGLLLLTAGSAFGGLAVLPAAASTGAVPGAESPAAPSTSTTDAATTRRAPHAPVRAAGTARSARQTARAEADAQAAAAVVRRERASRDRRPAPAAAVQAAKAEAAKVARAKAEAAKVARAKAAAKAARPAYVRPGTGALTSGYGRRWGRLHAGIDLAAGTGSPISAVAAGTVLSAGAEGAYGNCVRVQHPHGTVTLYAHLSQILVRKGQKVVAGTPLGREGSSGRSTGPHLHFEVRIGGAPVDPAPWLKARGIDPGRL